MWQLSARLKSWMTVDITNCSRETIPHPRTTNHPQIILPTAIWEQRVATIYLTNFRWTEIGQIQPDCGIWAGVWRHEIAWSFETTFASLKDCTCASIPDAPEETKQKSIHNFFQLWELTVRSAITRVAILILLRLIGLDLRLGAGCWLLERSGVARLQQARVARIPKDLPLFHSQGSCAKNKSKRMRRGSVVRTSA